MKYNKGLSKKIGYIGAGIGLLLFALFGSWQGISMGGTLGLAIVYSLSGASAGATLLGRLVVAASIVAGILVSFVMFVVLPAAVFWAAGYLLGLSTEPHAGLGKKVHAK